MKEIFIPIKGFEESYSISNLGNVKSIKRDKNIHIGFCGSYKRVNLFKDGKKYKKRIHRLIAEAFIENNNNERFINHKDGNKLNNDIKNLEWVSPRENSLHAAKTHLLNIHNKKLQYEDAQKIRRLKKEGHSVIEISKLYNVSRTTIYAILNNKIWDY